MKEISRTLSFVDSQEGELELHFGDKGIYIDATNFLIESLEDKEKLKKHLDEYFDIRQKTKPEVSKVLMGLNYFKESKDNDTGVVKPAIDDEVKFIQVISFDEDVPFKINLKTGERSICIDNVRYYLYDDKQSGDTPIKSPGYRHHWYLTTYSILPEAKRICGHTKEKNFFTKTKLVEYLNSIKFHEFFTKNRCK